MAVPGRFSTGRIAALFVGLVIVCRLSSFVSSVEASGSDAEENNASDDTPEEGRLQRLAHAPDPDSRHSPQSEAAAESAPAQNLSDVSHSDNEVADTGGGGRSRLLVGRLAAGGPRGLFARYRPFIALVLTLFFAALAGAVFLSTKPLRNMLAKDNAYADLCLANSTSPNATGTLAPTTLAAAPNCSTSNGTVSSGEPRFLCNEQEAQLEGLFSLIFTSCCVACALAGPLVDFLGARFTAVLGRTLEIYGLLFFHLNFYELGLVLIGAGQEVALLAATSVANFFPRSRSIILGLLGGAASLSALVMTVLEQIGTATRARASDVLAYYGVVVSFPALIAGLILLPERRPSPSAGRVADLSLVPHEFGEESAGVERRASFVTLSSPSAAPSEAARLPARLTQGLRALFRGLMRALRWLFRSVRNQRRSSIYIALGITVDFIIMSVINSYFIQAADRIFGCPGSYLEYTLPVAALPCALLGYAADRLGAAASAGVLAFAGLLMNLTSFLPEPAGGFTGLLFLTIYTSAVTSHVFWSSQEGFPERIRTTVTGLILALGGLFAPVSNWLYSRITLGIHGGDTVVPRVALLPLHFLHIALVYFVYRHIRLQGGQEDRVSRFLLRPFRRGRLSISDRGRSGESQNEQEYRLLIRVLGPLLRLLRRGQYTLADHERVRELPD